MSDPASDTTVLNTGVIKIVDAGDGICYGANVSSPLHLWWIATVTMAILETGSPFFCFSLKITVYILIDIDYRF